MPDQTSQNFYNLNAFALPPTNAGRFGSCGVGILQGPGMIDVDMGLAKRFQIGERMHVRFEATFTNVINHTNFAPPALNVGNPSTFGVLNAALPQGQGGNRTGQLGVADRLLTTPGTTFIIFPGNDRTSSYVTPVLQLLLAARKRGAASDGVEGFRWNYLVPAMPAPTIPAQVHYDGGCGTHLGRVAAVACGDRRVIDRHDPTSGKLGGEDCRRPACGSCARQGPVVGVVPEGYPIRRPNSRLRKIRVGCG